MRVEQYVMAYGIEQDRIRAILPDGFISIRPVVRINAEIREDKYGYLEFNTAVEKEAGSISDTGKTSHTKRKERQLHLKMTVSKLYLKVSELKADVRRKKIM